MLDNVIVKLPTVPGDINGDGVVDAADYIILKQNFGTTGTATRRRGRSRR